MTSSVNGEVFFAVDFSGEWFYNIISKDQKGVTVVEIQYVHEPTDLQCGQAVIAMLLAKPVAQVCEELGNERETTLAEMKDAIIAGGIEFCERRKQAFDKSELPRIALLSLETPRCWHWSLYCEGVFYDPEHGVMDDFPQSNRRFYWELKVKE